MSIDTRLVGWQSCLMRRGERGLVTGLVASLMWAVHGSLVRERTLERSLMRALQRLRAGVRGVWAGALRHLRTMMRTRVRPGCVQRARMRFGSLM